MDRLRPRPTAVVAWLTAAGAVAGVLVLAAGLGSCLTYVDVATWGDGRFDTGAVLRRPQFAVAVAVTVPGLAVAVVGAVCWWRPRSPRIRVLGSVGLLLVVVLGAVPAAGAAVALWPASAPSWTRVPRLATTPGLVDVETITRDGVRVRGWYVPSRNRAAVVLLPGSLSTRESVVAAAEVLVGHGYGALLLDPRGNGASGGSPNGAGWALRTDLAAALDWLGRRPDVDSDRLGVLGESLGGEGAVGALPGDPRIRAVVAEGVTAGVAADWDWLPARDGLPGAIRGLLYRIGYAFVELGSAQEPPPTLAHSVARAGRPVLLIAAGTQDDEVAAAESVRSAAPGQVQVWVAPGAAHADALEAAPELWRAKVLDFLDAELGPR